MTEDEKIEVAVFRYGVISDFINGSQMTRAEKRRLLREKCARKWNIPFSAKTRISKSTIRRWSRLITYAHFYLSENLACYLDAFENALARRGLPRKLYVDNGAAFRSKHLEYITASLAITLIHAKPYTPQRKIERWFKIVRSRFLTKDTMSILNPPMPPDKLQFRSACKNAMWKGETLGGGREGKF